MKKTKSKPTSAQKKPTGTRAPGKKKDANPKAPTFKVHGARLVIEDIQESSRRTTGGIYLPDTLKSCNCGKVMGIGPGVTEDIKVGDLILYHAPTSLPVLVAEKKGGSRTVALVSIHQHDALITVY